MADSGFDVADEVIVAAVFVVVIDVKANVLSRFEDVVDGEGLAEVRVDVIFDGLGPPQRHVLLLGEITFIGHFDEWV